ncbi:MAG: CocE/NonD family hydrolase [Aeromicrobium sp.]|uniref:CocE/NonD family hydrolase n=1 Tax=Aeromicrobium sp. TaxID=1871063 RepID=UPI0039E72AB5
MSDGVELTATLTSPDENWEQPRPTIVEFSPYGNDSQTFVPDENYNRVLVQIRGTGDSKGSFDALGPVNQADVPEMLTWICSQPWNDGNVGIHGFSASAIIIYNSMWQEFPDCVKTMTLRSGTFELYRDLLVPGGVFNFAPGAAVLAMIGGPAMLQWPDRFDDPASWPDWFAGMFTSGLEVGFAHPTLDEFWQQRGFRGDANGLPIMAVNGIFDVESRGAFEGYQALRDNGSQLVLKGGHDGHPAGTDGGQADMQAWYDYHLRGVDNGITDQPRVRMQMSDGDRESFIQDGDFVYREFEDYPVPGTVWESLALDASKADAADPVANDGSLTLGEAREAGTQVYEPLVTNPLVTDVPTASLVNNGGAHLLTGSLPGIADPDGLVVMPGLSYTTAPLATDVLAAGPPTLEVRLGSLNAETPIWAMISDVDTDGTAHPLTVGRLNSSFPDVVEEKSLKDASGQIVQPYGDFGEKTLYASPPTSPLLYQVELWPIANRFEEGHRIRLDILGASAFSTLSATGGLLPNTVEIGGGSGSRLLFPVLPESDLSTALPTDDPADDGDTGTDTDTNTDDTDQSGTSAVQTGTTAEAEDQAGDASLTQSGGLPRAGLPVTLSTLVLGVALIAAGGLALTRRLTPATVGDLVRDRLGR